MTRPASLRAARRALPALLLALALLVGGAGFLACTVDAEDDGAAATGAAASGSAGDSGEVLARVDGEPITRADVAEAAAAELEPLERQRHEIFEGHTRKLVRERLLAAEASRRGMTEDELLQAEVQSRSGAIDDAEIDAFYEENRARIPQPKEQVAEQIRQFLRQQRESAAYEEFMSGLEESRKVVYEIGPWRIDVAVGDAPSVGPADAPVTIVEFSDFECPYCSRVVPALDRIKEEYGDQVRLVFKQFPLSFHPNAQKAAEASLCAHDQGKFWPMHDAMFADAQNLDPEGLEAKAERIGLDLAAFRRCLESGEHAERVTQDMEEGQAAGVSGTPAMFVNGRLISGAVPYEQIAAVVDEELARAGR